MKRAAILIIPMEWFITPPNMVLKPHLLGDDEHRKLLRQYGCSEYALQWFHSWFEDFQYDAMMYRFVSEENETDLYITEPGCRAMFIDLYRLNKRCENTFKLCEINSMVSSSPKTPEGIFSKVRRISRI